MKGKSSDRTERDHGGPQYGISAQTRMGSRARDTAQPVMQTPAPLPSLQTNHLAPPTGKGVCHTDTAQGTIVSVGAGGKAQSHGSEWNVNRPGDGPH